jgi:hypothetical protein
MKYISWSPKIKCVSYLIVTGGYVVINNKGTKEVVQILEKLSFPWDNPWRYDPHIVVAVENGKHNPGANDHENRPLEERLANKNS